MFSNFISKYKDLFDSLRKSSTGINNSQVAAVASIRKYISDNYTGFLPDIVIKRNKYTDPIAFSILFKSALSTQYANLFDQWGLGWNLGFDKIDTIIATRHITTTFIRIIDDFLLNLSGTI